MNYTQEMLIGMGIACVVGGIILGLIGGRFFLRSKHAAELERELGAAKEEMKEYKNEVFQQFGDTARKFEKLNESYADLHQQLATSATVLCADMPDVPLLASSTVPALQTQAESEALKPEETATQANTAEQATNESLDAVETAEVVDEVVDDVVDVAEAADLASEAVTEKATTS